MGTLPPALAKYQAEKKAGQTPSSDPGSSAPSFPPLPKKKKKKSGQAPLPKTPANNKAIVARVENKLGAVRPGHHNSHRTAALMAWLDKQESKGKK